jgi:hypothetical protein
MITDLGELSGKTIKNGKMLNFNNSFGLFFTDGSYVVISMDIQEDGLELVIDPDVLDRDLFELGVICRQEYDKRIAELNKVNAESKSRAEYNLYLELKEKYGKIVN